MPIPKNLTEEHIRQAIDKIDREKYDPIYKSYNYFLECNGKVYPPKHVVRVANMIANGGNPAALTFYPSEAVHLLRRFNFIIREKHVPGKDQSRGISAPRVAAGEKISRDKRINDILYDLKAILESKKRLPEYTDLYVYITELSKQGYVPNGIAGLMHAIRKMRNDFTKSRIELSAAEFAALEANWLAIQEWAKK